MPPLGLKIGDISKDTLTSPERGMISGKNDYIINQSNGVRMEEVYYKFHTVETQFQDLHWLLSKFSQKVQSLPTNPIDVVHTQDVSNFGSNKFTPKWIIVK